MTCKVNYFIVEIIAFVIENNLKRADHASRRLTTKIDIRKYAGIICGIFVAIFYSEFVFA